MKRFIIKTLLLVSPVFLLVVSMEHQLQQIPNDYSYKKSYLDNNSGEIQILILGASGGFLGINPVYISDNAFNACHVSESLDWSFKILKKYQNKLNSLDIIILQITYPSLWYKLENDIESWRVKNYAVYYGIKSNSLKNNFEFLSNPFLMNIERLIKYYLKKNNDIACNSLGWGTGYKSELAIDLRETAKKAAFRHTVDIFSEENIILFNENLKVLNLFSEFCKQKNISLVFLTPPTYLSYRENIDYEQYNEMVKTINSFVKEHSNCYHLNFFDNNDFVAKDFFDADHLNEIGAEKLSLMIFEKLKEKNLIKP